MVAGDVVFKAVVVVGGPILFRNAGGVSGVSGVGGRG